MRLLNRFHSSGRWFLGSHWPFSSRNEKMRSLARDFSSSRRAPPIAASKPPLPQAIEKRLGLQQTAAALRAQPERVRAVVDGLAIGV
jgi:hypothetical protein